MVKLWQFLKELGGCFSPFLNFFMVKYRYKRSYWSRSFSPFLNFFMVKSLFSIIRKFKSFSPFLNFFMVK
ncbi:hypothetical protein DYW11_04450 [Campylobacter jejuni]|nr:hypothetical protein [Campylobacter jejuni]EAJ1534110.1 hypothetical protein [Campylobacter jejuni]EAJ6488176.1 hypothetical protein [Campylobacter jejuni]EAJ8260796.1 hypothetical protein [Campylobacter jejuni]EAJ8731433.1 hypothetical protein [Campylobacter jejuni]